MNIGIVTMWFERGAGYVSRQYRKLLQNDHNVFIYARVGEYPKGNSLWDDPNVTWGKPSSLPVPTAIDRADFIRWVEQKQLDIVFFNEQHWWEPLTWCTSLDVITGAYIDYYTEDTVPFFAAYDFLICNTRRHYSAFDWHPQAHYVPWGTDVDLYQPRSFNPVRSDRITFFHSCGYDPYRKGTDFILKAFDQLKSPAHLTIHSQVDLGKEFPELQPTVARLQEEQKLTLITETVAAPGLYHLGDVYLGLSRLEGIGLPLVEAQACGLPLITCDYPPMNEFVGGAIGSLIRLDRVWSRSDGYYWPQCAPDITHLTQVLQQYADNFAQIRTMKEQARHHALANLNWQDRAKQVQTIFSSIQRQPERTDKTARQAAQFERTRSGLQYRISLRYPTLWNLIRILRRR